MPTPILIVAASAGFAALLGASFRVMPLRQRPEILRTNLIPGAALFVVLAFLSRVVLWYGAILFLPLAGFLLLMGELPNDLPRNSDPAIRRHPEYPAIRRRGIAVSVGMVSTILVGVVLTAVYVK